ncbi:MAG: hypothetical protein ACFFFH_20220 [Candidatus Thorarchaeota archaeon]
MGNIRKWMVFVTIIGVIIFLGSQTLVIKVIELESRFGKAYTVYSDRSDLFFEDLGFDLDQTGRFQQGTTYNHSYYNFVCPTNGSKKKMMIEVSFYESFWGIKSYRLFNIPLNENKSYFGLATNGSLFWTLETTGFHTSDQKLICFSFDEVILNHTLSEPEVPIDKFEEYWRTILGIVDGSLVILELGEDYTNFTNKLGKINFLNGNSLQVDSSISLNFGRLNYEIHPWQVFLDQNGRFWSFSSEFSYGGYTHTYLSYNLREEKIDKTIILNSAIWSRDRYLDSQVWQGEIWEADPFVVFSSFMIDNGIHSAQKIIFPLRLVPAPASQITNRFIGFRVFSLEKNPDIATKSALWGIGTTIAIISVTIVFIGYLEEKKVKLP